MSEGHEVSYQVEFGNRRNRIDSVLPAEENKAAERVPRVARLIALAIKMDGLIRERKIRDYAEAARRGGITRARMTQIMQLLNLAADIQEQILLSSKSDGVRERNLRTIVNRIDWDEQRRLFQELVQDGSRSRRRRA